VTAIVFRARSRDCRTERVVRSQHENGACRDRTGDLRRAKCCLQAAACVRLATLVRGSSNRRVSDGKARASVPGRSREQRLRTLEQANEVRSARAKLKQQLAAGEIELAEILTQPPECARTLRVHDLLLVLPKIGSVKAGRILAHCSIAHSKTLAGLSHRQRAELLNLFRR
jgi:hypothetical protein